MLSINPALIEARDFRSFLRMYLEEQRKPGQIKPNQAAFARLARFSSRSYLSELLNGSKRLSHRSMMQILGAMKLRPEFKTLFKLLVLREQPELRPLNVGDDAIDRKVSETRRRIQRRYLEPDLGKSIDANAFFSSNHVCDVFAALGPEEQGATLAEIISRTGLSASIVTAVLERLIALQAVKRQEGRYYPIQLNLDFEALGANHGFLQAFRQSARDVAKLSENAPSQDGALFFHSAFSVRKDQLPELKLKLRQVLIDFLDTNQIDQGDHVQRLTLGFYHG